MARSTVAFTNFTAGELSPRLDGRTDLGKYFNGSKTLENMVVHPHGGASRRPGTKFIHEVKTSSAQTRLIPFEFSTTQTYIMEFGHQYIRFFKDSGIITESNKTISGATQANPIVITSNSHGYNNGDHVIISGVVGMTELNGKTFKVADKTTNTFELQNVDGTDINSSAYTAYGSGGVANKIYEIASPYSTADLPTIKFAQSADLMYLVHPSYAIRKLTRSGHTNWTLSTPSLSGSPSPTINNATDKYPSSVSFFEQRLVFAGSNDNPQTMWFSKSADLENFTTGTNDTDAMVYTIASNKVNAIRYISAQRSLIVGTVGGEFVVSASGTTQPITPTNVQIQRQSSYGAANIDAVQIENVTMFVQRAKRKLRELSYNLNIDQYQAQDMTLLAEHITEGGVLEMAYQQEPDSILWCARNDGTLLGFTYARAEEVVGWHRHILGGAFSSGQAVVESVATIPTDANEDELYLIVKRTINGTTRRYVEYLTLFDYGTDQTDAFYVDSGLTYSGSAATVITGLDHLEGQSVTILANGSTHPNKTVSGGSITLDRSATKAHIGLGYTSTLQTMRVEAPGNESTSQAKTKRINEVTLRLHETVGAEVGSSLSDMERIPFRSSAAAMDTAVPLFTGDKQIEFRDDFNTDAWIYVRQNQPLPLTLISIYPQITIND
ncbi:MAG: hypothetical protein Unbinned2350contig1001_8 [Prokaryotic dsDNA virus sp.]|nr:MAG: hypothetical protein Unbinned2350contig1001_8 [Prokaryotic dsDNA virus sp.]|tara:strand:- start:12133 stop:14130 length:1998 start_codon:yes stop_codon:yes gene_type:complete